MQTGKTLNYLNKLNFVLQTKHIHTYINIYLASLYGDTVFVQNPRGNQEQQQRQ